MDRGELVGSVFIDLTKAFDTVGHSILLGKLPEYGINDTELNWLTHYLFNRTQQVVVNSVHSETNYITCGVPQGSILGPLLFLIHFNDFEDALTKCKVIMFADDTVIYCRNKLVSVIESSLNVDLENIAHYLKENDHIINLGKGFNI